jgi:chromosomal replication initiator protein
MKSAAIGQEQWQRVKKRLRAELGEDVFTSWFTRVDLEESANGTIHLSVPTRFLKQWIQSHYCDRLMGLWRNECETIQRIELTVRGAIRPRAVKAGDGTVAPQNQRPGAARLGSHVGAASGTPARQQSLDPRLTFATFAKGRSNELAIAAAHQVATARRGDTVSFNPLYIHASVGLGKTHLLQAVAWDAGLGDNSRRVQYLTAEGFMYGFVNALKTKSAMDFKDRLRGIELLLIDDLQFLYGKQIQQEFCHTLNALMDNGRQVVVAADRPPVELEALDDRVRSRLSGGLVVEIGSPDYDLRRHILNRRISDVRVTYPDFGVPDPVIDYIARSIVSNGRDLDGAINRLVAHNQLTGSALSIEMAEVTLRDLVRSREPKRVRIEDIQRIVSKHYNVSKADLLSARRTRTIVRPRQVAMYLSKMMTPRSLPEIGRRFGGRDHTTVLHAVRKIESLVSSDQLLAEEIELLKRLLDG